MLAAVNSRGMALEIVAEELRADKDVVLTAVRNNRYALKYAALKLQTDPDVLAACKNN